MKISNLNSFSLVNKTSKSRPQNLQIVIRDKTHLVEKKRFLIEFLYVK